MLNIFGDDRITIIHDGPTGALYEYIKSSMDTTSQNINLYKIRYNSNEKSLIESLNYGRESTSKYIYFLEDDYYHKPNSRTVLFEGLNLNTQFRKIVSLYDHPDRYTRTDDMDYGHTRLFLGNRAHWRTAESTTCTWAVETSLYKNEVFDVAMAYKLNDRGFFRAIYESNIRLITPIPAMSTHCHEPFISPFFI